MKRISSHLLASDRNSAVRPVAGNEIVYPRIEHWRARAFTLKAVAAISLVLVFLTPGGPSTAQGPPTGNPTEPEALVSELRRSDLARLLELSPPKTES